MLILLVFKSGEGLEDNISSECLLLMIFREDKSKVLLGPEIFFELEDERSMELSNKESIFDLEGWDANDVNYFYES